MHDMLKLLELARLCQTVDDYMMCVYELEFGKLSDSEIMVVCHEYFKHHDLNGSNELFLELHHRNEQILDSPIK